jgi:ubiquinone/menaquinone biosynthesis C-methylase UbiE
MYIFVGLVGFLMVIWMIWRLGSRRHAMPCPVWLHWLVELENPFTRISRAAVIIDHLEVQPGMVVLDAGCGPGRVTVPLARRVGNMGKVVALDLQSGMLKRAQQKAAQANLTNIEFVLAGLGEGKLPRDQFDRVLLVTVLGEIKDRETALQEIYNSLKPSGLLSITEIMFDPHYQRRSTVIQLANSAGFRQKSVYGNCVAFTLNFEKIT